MISIMTDSLYQDPITLACTGPPGTPSPIRDALHSSSHQYQNVDFDSSDVYADPDSLPDDVDSQHRGSPDGESVFRRDDPV